MADEEKQVHERKLTPEELEKVRVDTEKARAEIEKIKFETLAAQAESRRALASALSQEMDLERKQRDEKRTLAENKYFHIYEFSSEVSEQSVKSCQNELNIWHRTEPECPIEIVFDSPGGGVIAGMALFDYLTQLKRQGHHLTTTCRGFAASMAGILLQVGDVRQIGAQSYILIHEISFGAFGKIGEVEDEVEFVHKIQDQVLDVFAARALQAKDNGTAKAAFTRKQFAEKWRRKDWWLNATQALDGGVVDKIL